MNSRDLSALVAEVHTRISHYQPARQWWKCQQACPELPDSVLASTWDPASPTLKPWQIYESVLRAVEAPESDVRAIRQTYRRAEMVRQADAPWHRTVTHTGLGRWSRGDVAGDRRGQVADLVARLETTDHHALPPELNWIADEAGFMEQLRRLRVRSGLSYRQIEQHTFAIDREHGLRRSTLSDVLNRDTIPSSEPQLLVLLQVLTASGPAHPHGVAASRALTQDYIAVWRRLQAVCAVRAQDAVPVSAAPTTPEGGSVRDALSGLSREDIELLAVTNGGMSVEAVAASWLMPPERVVEMLLSARTRMQSTVAAFEPAPLHPLTFQWR